MSKIIANQIQHSANGAVAFNLPQTDGSNGQVIQTNGSNTLSFTTVNTDYYSSEETVDLSTVGASYKTIDFSNDPKKIEFTFYRAQKANSNSWRMRLRKGSVDHITGYYDIGHTAQSDNSTSTARQFNSNGWYFVNSGWTGGTNNISGTMNITRVVQGKYVFDAHWIFHYAPSTGNNEQYWLSTHGEVDIGSNACTGLKFYTSNSGNFTSGHAVIRTITG
tara:strand:- start:48 stop:707 length:660 start_codon:yes stop_codon:yes gene_type:complete